MKKQTILQVMAIVLSLWFSLPAAAQPTSFDGFTFHRVKAATNPYGEGTNSTSWNEIGGTTRVVNIPSNKRILLIARFTGSSTCRRDDGSLAGGCRVRILTDGVEMYPVAGAWSMFDQVNGSVTGSSRGIERSRMICKTSTQPTVEVKVEHAVSHAPVYFNLFNWHLTIETYEYPGSCPAGGY